jgi:ABC-type Fe3+/spermidine/putrescine transport system ATPase subunit
MVLSDRIIIMNLGKIAQMGSPQEIYQNLSNRYLLLRPERIRMLREQPGSAVNLFRGVVKNIAYLGNLVNYVVVVKDMELRIQSDPRRGVFRHGEEVVMSIEPKEITLIPENSKMRRGSANGERRIYFGKTGWIRKRGRL